MSSERPRSSPADRHADTDGGAGRLGDLQIRPPRDLRTRGTTPAGASAVRLQPADSSLGRRGSDPVGPRGAGPTLADDCLQGEMASGNGALDVRRLLAPAAKRAAGRRELRLARGLRGCRRRSRAPGGAAGVDPCLHPTALSRAPGGASPVSPRDDACRGRPGPWLLENLGSAGRAPRHRSTQSLHGPAVPVSTSTRSSPSRTPRSSAPATAAGILTYGAFRLYGPIGAILLALLGLGLGLGKPPEPPAECRSLSLGPLRPGWIQAPSTSRTWTACLSWTPP